MAAKYYKLSADQNYATGQNNFGFCLEQGRGVERNIEFASKYYKRASALNHPEAEFNYRRCLRLRNQWEISPQNSTEDLSPKSLAKNKRSKAGDDSLQTFPERPRSEMPSEWVKKFDGMKELREIGSGGFGIVKLVQDSEENMRFAVKIPRNIKDWAQSITREIDALISLKHPCILGFLGFSLPTDKSDAMIVTEYVPNGSLEENVFIGENEELPRLQSHTKLAKIVVGIVHGMLYMHSKNMLHRDLKPANILLDHFWHPRICDFGLSRFSDTSRTLTDQIGTDRYMAPELYEKEDYTDKIDVFAFGITLYEILVGKPACSRNLNCLQIMCRAVNGKRPDIPDYIPLQVKDLITRCWSVDPDTRSSFAVILLELKAMRFKIFPDVRSQRVSEYCEQLDQEEAKLRELH
jgi:serine/threonine protein kinase